MMQARRKWAEPAIVTTQPRWLHRKMSDNVDALEKASIEGCRSLMSCEDVVAPCQNVLCQDGSQTATLCSSAGKHPQKNGSNHNPRTLF